MEKIGNIMKYTIILVSIFALCDSHSDRPRSKRMYGLCPPNFHRIGSACYFLSSDRMNWLDAHFECKDRNSKLAEPVKITDRQLRKYLIAKDQSDDEIWIGGSYEWNKRKWVWGYSGYDIKYQSFSQMEPSSASDLQYHCAVLNPELKYRWAARPCVDLHRFICQHKMPKVTARNRDKVYNRWNETYPNQKANEVMLEVVDNANYARHERRQKDNNTTNSTSETKSPLHEIIRPARKRSQWRSFINEPNNETIEKSTKKPTDFDKIAERKRQKEIRRRNKVQQQRRQKKEEMERRRKEELERLKKAQEILNAQRLGIENFPPPVTEVLMFHEIKYNDAPTKETKLEAKDEPSPTLSTTIAAPTILPSATTVENLTTQAEKRTTNNEGTTPNLSSEEKRNAYLKKIKQRIREERKRIEEEELKRERLKKIREENIEKLKQVNEELKNEEVTPSTKSAEEEKNPKEEELLREKKAKEEEEKQKSYVKQAARMEALRKYKEKLRKLKEEKFRVLEASNSTEDGDAQNRTHDISEDEKKARLQKLRDRLQKLTPEQRQRFHELRMQRKQQKLKRSHLAIN